MRIYYRVSYCILCLLSAFIATADPGTYILSPKAGSLGTGEEIQVQVRKVFAGNPRSQPISAAEQRNLQWALNASTAIGATQWGTLTPGLVPGTYTYKAPSAVPARNPVAISVSFTDASGQKIVLVSNIRITTCSFSFQQDEDDPICFSKQINSQYANRAMSLTGLYFISRGTTLITAQGMDKDMKLYTVQISFAGKGPGVYEWDFEECACEESGVVNGDVRNTTQVMIGAPGGSQDLFEIFTCRDCNDPDNCLIVPMQGVIYIYEYGPPGGKIRGVVAGTFIRNPPSSDGTEVVFRFEVTRHPDIK
ncbi:MAG TPA: hypothetical protein VD993_03125 [Chitinophagaceae bacterium]|nr:hypothetical protein [Chitinophagaceae bacterium]